MDSTRQDQHQWSDWFSKAPPSAEDAEEGAVPAEDADGPSSGAAQNEDPVAGPVAGDGPATPGDPAAQTADFDISKATDPAPDNGADPSGDPAPATPSGVTAADIRNTRPPRDEQDDRDGGAPGDAGPFGPLDRRVPGQTLRGQPPGRPAPRDHQPSGGQTPATPAGTAGSGGPAWTPPWRLPRDESITRRLPRDPASDRSGQEPTPTPPPAAPPTVAQPIVTPEQARALYEAETAQADVTPPAAEAEPEARAPFAPPTVAQPIVTPEQARALYEAETAQAEETAPAAEAETPVAPTPPTVAQPIVTPEQARAMYEEVAPTTSWPIISPDTPDTPDTPDEEAGGADWAEQADVAAVADGSVSEVWTEPSMRSSGHDRPDDEPTGVDEIRQAEGTQTERNDAAPGDQPHPEAQAPAIPFAPPTVAQPIVTREDARKLPPPPPTMAQPIVTPEEAASMLPVAPTVAQPILTPAEATAMSPVEITKTDLPVMHAPVTYYGPGRRPPTEGRPGAAPQEGAEQAEAAEAAEPQGKAAAKTDRHATYKRPEMLSSAETVMLPQVKPPLKPSPKIARASTADTGAQAVMAAGAASVEAPKKLIDQEPTSIMAVQAPPRKAAAPPRPDQPYTASQRRKWISRGVLLAILLMQAVLSLRLHNAAFEDEAQYLYAGRLEILHLFHHQPLPLNFAAYFSGAPVLYPVAGAWADSIGGLAAARALSLVEMLATTGLLYTISRRLFNERAAICAALLYSVTMSVTFLGHFATYDATCLFLLAVTAWIMVRTALLRWPVFLLAIPVAALAVAVKYAGALFLPTIAVLPILTAWPYRRRRVWAYPVVFAVGVGALLYLGLKWGGHSYTEALSSTTTSRAKGTTPIGHIGWESLKWGGVVFFAAVLGSVAYAWRPRTDPEEEIAPAGSRLRRILLGLVLTCTALLAPLYQAHLHTDVSFLKHIGFGLFFAAPMAGVGLARIMGDHFRRPQIGIAVWGLALLLGMTEATHLYGAWGNETAFVKSFSTQLKPGAKYLVEIPEVPIYYLQGNKEAQAQQFSSTFVLVYQNPKGAVLSGTTAYEAAIANNYFQVVAYEGFTTPATDNAIASELAKNKNYKKVTVVSDSTKYHDGTFTIWVRKAGVKGQGKLIG
ncbi:MAG TPA: glycosyltransferase family 39 protein [Streptosporangiaceae bacterium]|nr:glycosyltransferase family 39 protein [Streptosporangiaceae bacterium]